MLLQFKLHFTSLLPSSHVINAALFTPTITDFAGLPPLHHMPNYTVGTRFISENRFWPAVSLFRVTISVC